MSFWIAGAAVVGSVGGAYLQSKGANKAAGTAAKGADAAAAESARQFDLVRGDTANARAIGDQALSALGGIYGYRPAANYFGTSPIPAGAQPFSASYAAPNINDTGFGRATTGLFNPGSAAGRGLGIKPTSTFGKVLDPLGGVFGKAFSGHGDERRNLQAFMADNQLYDLGNGMVSLADGRTFSKDQLQQVAGAYYGARYHPDGDQAGWQSRYDAALSPAQQGGMVGQAGGGMTSEGVPQGFTVNQGMTPNGQPTGPSGQSMDPNSPNYGAFFQSPDYQFRKQQGMQGIGNLFSASGGAKSGNALKALADFNSNLAAGEFGNYFNRQAALAGIGQTGVGQSASAGIATGGIVGNAMQNSADARASGIAGGYNAIGAGLSGLGQGLGYYLQQRKNPGAYQSPYYGWGGEG